MAAAADPSSAVLPPFSPLLFVSVCLLPPASPLPNTTVSPSTKPITSAVVGAALGAAVVYAGIQAKQKRDGAAVIDLYNYLVEVSE